MPVVSLSPVGNEQYFTNDGEPLSGGKIYFYQGGSFTIQRNTYSDATGNTLNTNPIVLNSAGRANVDVFGEVTGSYNIVLATSDDTILQSWESVSLSVLPTNLSITGNVSVAGTVTANAFVGNVATISGNVAANYFTGNGALLTSITASSANVTFTQQGANAISQTVQSKLYQVVNIADFGASASANAAVNTAAINSAIQAADTIYIPSGTFQCNTITMRSGVSIYGNGPTSVLQFAAGQTGLYGLSPSASTYLENINISNLRLVGAVEASGFSEFIHLIDVNGVRNLTIDTVQFIGFQGDGLYLGAFTDNTRHNFNVKVVNCLFDGVNKDNRNAISVIDCDTVMIKNNTFQNATRSNMPGFIDVEPNNNANVVKNIQVIGNSFQNTDAAEGAVCIVIVVPTLTTDPHTFIISNNTFNINKRMVSFRVAGSYTINHNLVVSGNTGQVQTVGDYYPRIRGAVFTNNTLSVTASGNFGFDNTDTINNLTISNNTIDGGGSANRAFSLRSGSGQTIVGNVFSNFAVYGFLCGISGGTLSNTNIIGNTFISCGTYAVGSSGGIDGVSCVFLNNIHDITHQFPAWRTDDTGNITNGDSNPTTFNGDNSPADFTREGIYRAQISGDTAVPNTTSYQGMLETHCETGQSGAKWKFQVYWPANNGTQVNSFYTRKSDASNVWSAWAEHAGV
jgi:cytoskeletal protein CcmA (bactofilin family)